MALEPIREEGKRFPFPRDFPKKILFAERPIARGSHPFPFRTRKLSSIASMVLHVRHVGE